MSAAIQSVLPRFTAETWERCAELMSIVREMSADERAEWAASFTGESWRVATLAIAAVDHEEAA